MPRYILPVLPYLFIVGAYAIVGLFKNGKLQVVSAALIAIIFVSQYRGEHGGLGSFDEDMQYADVVLNHKEMCRYIEETLPGKTVLSGWPISDALANPYLGYVKTPVTVVSLNEPYDIVAYTQQGPGSERVRESARLHSFRLIRIFERNGKYAEVYIKDSLVDQEIKKQ